MSVSSSRTKGVCVGLEYSFHPIKTAINNTVYDVRPTYTYNLPNFLYHNVLLFDSTRVSIILNTHSVSGTVCRFLIPNCT